MGREHSLRKNWLVRQNTHSDAKQTMFPSMRHDSTGISSTRFPPAFKALFVQCVALVTVLFAVFLWNIVSPDPVPFYLLVLAQAIVASGYSVLTGMASWWRWIHFCFPIALWGMSKWHVPNDIYLIGFLVSLSLFWTTFRSQVPFFPSRPIVWQNVAALIPQNKPIRMIDIGSGLGDLVMHIAKARPESRIEGIEIAPLPWFASLVRGRMTGSSAIFERGDYQALDFAEYDVVFAYLSPAAMPALWEKASREMRPGSMLISYEFEIPDVQPHQVIDSARKLFVWKL